MARFNHGTQARLNSYTVGEAEHRQVVVIGDPLQEGRTLTVNADGTITASFTAQKASTATLSNVASSATNVTLLASSSLRLGATIHNDSTAILYVKFGATATSSSYTVKMIADAYYEVPFSYTGIIDGIWASANGNARITAFSA